jgi:hypothetical protein
MARTSMLSCTGEPLKPHSMNVRLESAGSRWGFVLFVLLITGGFCWQAVRVWIAAEYAASANPQLWRKAARLEPDNAAYWAQLGSIEAWNFEGGDPEQAAADYERAVTANPHSDRNWLELAAVYERRGQTLPARAAYERAHYNHPVSPVVAWRYGNFLLRQGRAPEACTQFRKALLADPELTEHAVAVWWKGGLAATQPIAEILPPQNAYYFKAMDYFSRQNEIDAALHVWDDLLKLGQPIELGQALSLVNDTISTGRAEDAQRVWQQALDVSGWPRESKQQSSLIFNGGFEHDFANGGFDWRELESPDASYTFDMAVVHSGSRSLRVSFNGKSNLDFQHVLQYVAVEPAHHYKFGAYLRSAGVSTDSGVRFLIGDPVYPALPQVFTEGVTGSQTWTRVETEILVGPDTRLLRVALRRTPSVKFDNKLRGTVWVDDVSLVPLEDSGKDVQ